MDTDKIIQDLNRRFAVFLPEFYQRRIIFWYDEDKKFEDKLDEVVLENAKVIALTGNNAFSVKKLLSVDDLTTNYLVYSPCVYNRPDDNWLLDVELYSEEFRADLISIWMDEIGLISNPAMRKQVKNYRAYFNAKDRRLKVSTQNKVPETPAQLHMAVMAAICGLKDAQPNMILRSVFQAGLDLNNNTVYQDFVKYHADAAFWAMVRQGCGFVEEEPDLGRLAIHLLLTAATRTMRQEYLAGLDSFISIKRCVEYGRRYAIMQKGVQPDYLMPVKFLGGNTEFDGFAPRESIRIKMNGGGMNFVHGGISLQEMVVPVIEYHYLRNDSMEYKRNKQKYDTKPVTVNLLSANRKISNMIFSLNFYQKDAVSTNREAAIYQVYFTDEDGKQISDIQKIIADKTSDNGAERTFRCQFNLKSLKYSNTATYYLVIADEQGLQMPQREPFQIDIAFAVDEFDFFS